MNKTNEITVPAVVNKTRRKDGVLYVAGEGPRDARIMFLAGALLEEEATEEVTSAYGPARKVTPRYLRGPAGSILKDVALSVGVDMNNCYYTSVCKWLLPKASRMKPSRQDLAAGMPALKAEIEEVKPDIIVCLGKPAFDMLSNMKLALKDIAGAWFRSDEFDCLLYPMESHIKLVTKPEYLERFRMDILEIKRTLDRKDGIKIEGDVVESYVVVHNAAELREYVREHKNTHIVSVDCEWQGINHVDGQLRSIQLATAPGVAAYIRFMDDQLNYVFDVSYKEAGAIMGQWLDDPKVKYVGHHLPADLPWMHHVLGLKWYDKAFLDTEFAQQTVDEHTELSLERLGMLYTTLGRYDRDLTVWSKKNPDKVRDGYGLIPDEILIPYALRDVDVVIRSYKQILTQLMQQGTYDYYCKVFQPMTVNVFTNFVLNGLPMNVQRLDDLRELYHYCRGEMDKDFRMLIVQEAHEEVRQLFESIGSNSAQLYPVLCTLLEAGDREAAFSVFKSVVGVGNLLEHQPLFDHLATASIFNIRSPEQMKRWLFDVKGYTPLKSTNNREKGLPSMDWSKVLELPEERQKEFTPSTDRQTLEILQTQHDSATLTKLIELNAVGNICKAFLKKGTGEGADAVEAGLHYFVASDDRIHGQTSTTETGRPRSWKPNSLNWPKWVNNKIADGMCKILLDRKEIGSLPDEFEGYLEYKENKKKTGMEWVVNVPSIRSCIQAPKDWCMVESDYQTAEIRALAFLSQDPALVSIITGVDVCFAQVKPEKMVDDDCVCRLSYPEYLQNTTSPLEKVLMTYTVDGETLATFTEADLLRDDDGNIMYTKNDLHWSLAEMVHNTPREMLSKDRDRGAAKVGNFSCIAANALIATSYGDVPIANISIDHRVWDGLEWVHHEGTKYKGVSPCIEYDGLVATPDHVVWVADGREMPLLQAARSGCALLRPRREDSDTRSTTLRMRYHAMIQRCETDTHVSSHNYKGRGIEVLFVSAADFVLWALEKWPDSDFKGLDFDRIDNDGHYEKENLRLVPRSKNLRNTRISKGSLREKAEAFLAKHPEVSYTYKTVWNLLQQGLTTDKILKKFQADGCPAPKRKRNVGVLGTAKELLTANPDIQYTLKQTAEFLSRGMTVECIRERQNTMIETHDQRIARLGVTCSTATMSRLTRKGLTDEVILQLWSPKV
jgi:uracil-DNA glycosylase family 4